MRRTMSMLSSKGDTLLAEYDVETKEAKIAKNGDPVSGMTAAEIAEVETLFKNKLNSGYAAFVTTDKKNEMTKVFDPQEDILLVPAMRGGLM